MMLGFVRLVQSIVGRGLQAAGTALSRLTKPNSRSPARGIVSDLTRSKSQLVAENLLLRQQLVVLNRSVRRPRLTRADRGLFILLASKLESWRDALLIVRPETVLRWHRKGWRLFWGRKTRTRAHEPKIPAETIKLITEIAADNRLWGAERIRGELLKLGITVAKRTVQRYMRRGRSPSPGGQTWSTFLRTHAKGIWACDFLQAHDVFFRPLFAFLVTELGSRRIAHLGATRSPRDGWVAQQLRGATPFGVAPMYLIRDNDAKFGPRFEAVATWTGVEVLRTPIKAPRANAICERLLGSVRRECLDHILIPGEAHLRRALKEYGRYFNRARPHQGIGQRLPQAVPNRSGGDQGEIVALPILGGLHHDYRRMA
jgi:transposase InsO family protein